ncbi:diguanylate cyclase [Kineococcus sp. NBC_00420]|uniref:diguanylate cyclase domain-containing protein n=1 Tax=Kineococcus sp. NBC_00420 TaxID=2903564 RepID=UPI002E2517D5
MEKPAPLTPSAPGTGDRIDASVVTWWRAHPAAMHLAFAVAYAGAVVAGRATRLPGSTLSLVWPAAAVGFVWVACCWHQRRGRVLTVAAVAVLSGLLNAATGAGALLGAAFAVANGVQAATSCLVTYRWHRRGGSAPWRLRNPADLTALVLGSVAGSAAAACVGPLALHLSAGTPLLPAAGAWLVRNAASTFVFAAFALRLADRGRRWRTGWRSGTEIVAATVVVVAAYTVVFTQTEHLPLAFALLPFSMWIALRFHTTTTTGHVLLIGIWVVAATMAGRGPFAVDSPATRVLLAQAFVTVIGLAALVLALIRDERADLVAGLRRAQQEAAEQAALLREVFETTGDGLSVYDARGAALLRNRAAMSLFPDLPLDLAQERWTEFFSMRHPDGRPWPVPDLPVSRALRGETVENADVLVTTPAVPAGRLLNLSAHPLPPATGQRWAGGVVLAARDVSAERAAAARLAASERRFRAAFDTAPISMMIVGLTGRDAAQILQVNATLSEFTGFAAWELLQLDHHALTHPEDRGECVTAFAPFLDGRAHETRVEKRYRHADGSTRWGLLSATVLTDSGWNAATSGGPDDEPYLLCLIEDITVRRAAEDLLRHQALHDPLTGLPNRTLMHDRLTHALAATSRDRTRVGVLFCDLDGFKAVNDAAGHATGDDLLREVADRFSTCLRPGDTLARLGGDEFAVVCPGLTEEQDLSAIAERLLASLRAPVVLTRGTFTVGASIGMTSACVPAGVHAVTPIGGSQDTDGTDGVGALAEAVLAEADEAMYDAKRGGKNRAHRHGNRPLSHP